MSREIRRVPPNWEHPKDLLGRYERLIDESYEDAIDRWVEGRGLWRLGLHPDYDEKYADDPEYTYEEECGWAPRPNEHRPTWTEEPTWWQVYETVSEGTPVSPAFSTAEELVDYLAENGDYPTQRFGYPIPSRAACEAFVREEYAPTMVSGVSGGERKVSVGINSFDDQSYNKE